MTITSAVDASGEPGFDMALPGGRAPNLSWPVPFEVLRVVRNSSAEFRREAGDPRRGYGNLVELRFRDPLSGRSVDVLSAHHDRINPALRVGGRYPAGTVIGNQGRTGSTTGPHFSLDFFDPGQKTAGSTTLAIRNRFRDGFASGSTFGNSRRPPASGRSAVPQAARKFLRFLSSLESDHSNAAVGYMEAVGGGRAKGRFQFTPVTLQDARDRFGISSARLLSDNEAVQQQAVLEFIQKAHPDAHSAILGGRFAEAERLLNRRWTSLRGGAKEATPQRRREALKNLAGASRAASASPPSMVGGMATSPPNPTMNASSIGRTSPRLRGTKAIPDSRPAPPRRP